MELLLSLPKADFNEEDIQYDDHPLDNVQLNTHGLLVLDENDNTVNENDSTMWQRYDLAFNKAISETRHCQLF